MANLLREIFISVDVETSGPIPGEYSMLSIGACIVGDRARTFYIELKPLSDNHTPEALAISGLSMKELAARGTEPRAAMRRLAEWVDANSDSARPVFVGFNAAFDWSFINYYFIRFLGKNPFGHTALDIKSYYMGALGSDWHATSRRKMDPRFLPNDLPLKHQALEDAIEQAELFERLLAYTRERLAESC